MDGKKCGGEHSSLVCGSGSAYCGSAKVSKFSKLSSSDSSSISSSDSEASLSSDEDNFSSNLDSLSMLQLQDVMVLGGSDARCCWDIQTWERCQNFP